MAQVETPDEDGSRLRRRQPEPRRRMTAGWRSPSGGAARNVTDVAAVVVILAAFALPLRGLMRYQGPPMEEGFMLAFPQRVLAGDVPNKDFLHLYGPGSLWALAGLFKAFGSTLATERLFGLAQHMGIVFGVYAVARAWGRRLATACALVALVVIIGPIGLTALAWNGAVALGLCGLALGLAGRRRAVGGDEPGGRRRLLGAGLLAGLALLFRPDLVVAVTLGFGALAWGLGRDRVKWLLGGAAAGVSPYLVHLASAGVGNAFEGMFVEPVFRLRGGRSLPIPPSWDEFDGFLQKAAGVRESTWPLPMLDRPHQVFLWFVVLPVVAVGVAAVGVWRIRAAPAEWRSRVLLTAGLFGVGMLPQALQRPDTAHLAWVSCVPLALAPLAITEVVRAWRPRLPAAAIGVGVVGLFLIAVIPFQTTRLYVDLVGQSFGRNVFGASITRDGRNFYYGSAEVASAAQAVADRLDAEARDGERLLVGPVDLRRTPYSEAFFYYLFPELTPATRYIEMDPGIANDPGSGLADEVRSADWLILSDVWSGWDEPNDSRLDGPDEPNRVVAEDFCLVEEFRTGEDQRLRYQLWRNCA
jgi:hypothetical protein